MRNNLGGGGHWVGLRLIGTTDNRNAIGARLTLTAGSLRQVREVKPSGSYLSSSERRVHFGVGSATRVQRLQIRWPGGQEQELTDLPVDRVHRIVQPAR